MTGEHLSDLSAIGTLEDPVRRRVYEWVAAAPAPCSRDEAAKGAGISRSLAAYHLDKLAGEGLLSVAYERRSGRTGPGAGRPAKLYEPTRRELTVSVPARDYGLAARMLAEAASGEDAADTRRALREAAVRLGHEIGREAGDGDGDLHAVLRTRGYEPYDDDGVIRLRNCPFHAVAREHPELICDMNLALLEGVAEELPGTAEASLEPAPGRCCVALRTG